MNLTDLMVKCCMAAICVFAIIMIPLAIYSVLQDMETFRMEDDFCREQGWNEPTVQIHHCEKIENGSLMLKKVERVADRIYWVEVSK